MCTYIAIHTSNHKHTQQHLYACTYIMTEKTSGYLLEIHYPDPDLKPFRIVANYFKHILHIRKVTLMVANTMHLKLT